MQLALERLHKQHAELGSLVLAITERLKPLLLSEESAVAVDVNRQAMPDQTSALQGEVLRAVADAGSVGRQLEEIMRRLDVWE